MANAQPKGTLITKNIERQDKNKVTTIEIIVAIVSNLAVLNTTEKYSKYRNYVNAFSDSRIA